MLEVSSSRNDGKTPQQKTLALAASSWRDENAGPWRWMEKKDERQGAVVRRRRLQFEQQCIGCYLDMGQKERIHIYNASPALGAETAFFTRLDSFGTQS